MLVQKLEMKIGEPTERNITSANSDKNNTATIKLSANSASS
jgi:hypothetical protein